MPITMVYLPAVQFVQLSHAFSALECWPLGQLSQAVVLSNGSNSGSFMNVPASQHPSRPVVVKRLLEDNACHWPPHKVRENPLFWNTGLGEEKGYKQINLDKRKHPSK